MQITNLSVSSVGKQGIIVMPVGLRTIFSVTVAKVGATKPRATNVTLGIRMLAMLIVPQAMCK